MTLISKVKTLIEYAKFGVGICNIHQKQLTDLYIPKGIGVFNNGFVALKQNEYVRTIEGSLQEFGVSSGYACQNMSNLERVDLPKLTLLGATHIFSTLPKLREVKMPSIRELKHQSFNHCSALEHFEVGSLVYMLNTTFATCTNVKTFVCGEGTNCNLYLYPCKNLTQECLHETIDKLADCTGLSAPTFHIGLDNIPKISDECLQKLELKNWLIK